MMVSTMQNGEKYQLVILNLFVHSCTGLIIYITFLFYLFGRNSPVLAFLVNRLFINKEVVFVI